MVRAGGARLGLGNGSRVAGRNERVVAVVDEVACTWIGAYYLRDRV